MGVLVLAGCAALRTDHPPVDAGMPAAWHLDGVDTSSAPLTVWWSTFGDPVLQELVVAALDGNRDLAIAAARVAQARANLALVRSEQFPTVSAQASAARARSSVTLPGAPRIANDFALEGLISYEVDLWGRLQRSTDAARADLLATAYGRETVRLTLIADVARSYFTLRSLDLQLEIAQRTLRVREDALRLAERRWRGGVTSELDYRQAEVALQNAAAVITNLEQQTGVEQSTLSLLLGRFPHEIPRGVPVMAFAAPPDVPVGLPSVLLARRPDILTAEQNLLAANARIDAARTLYFPTIALTGAFGWASSSLSNLLSSGALFWQVGAAAAQSIFNAGRTRAQVELLTAQQQELLAQYAKTVQASFAEVENALIRIRGAAAQHATQAAQVASTERTLALAETRYRNGYSSFLEVLDAQRNLFTAELAQVQARETQLTSLVTLYRALGGGWDPAAIAADVEPSRPGGGLGNGGCNSSCPSITVTAKETLWNNCYREPGGCSRCTAPSRCCSAYWP